MNFEQDFLDTDDRVVKLGDDLYYMYYGNGDNPYAGIFLIHKDADGEQCVETYDVKIKDGTHYYADDGHWQMISTDWGNLSMMPSIVCTKCGLHGYIVNNEWVDPFVDMPWVPVEQLMAETVPDTKDHGCGNWDQEKAFLGKFRGEQVREIAESLVHTRTFYNPIVVRGNVVEEGRVRLYTAWLMNLDAVQVHYVKPDEKEATVYLPVSTTPIEEPADAASV